MPQAINRPTSHNLRSIFFEGIQPIQQKPISPTSSGNEGEWDLVVVYTPFILGWQQSLLARNARLSYVSALQCETRQYSAEAGCLLSLSLARQDAGNFVGQFFDVDAVFATGWRSASRQAGLGGHPGEVGAHSGQGDYRVVCSVIDFLHIP